MSLFVSTTDSNRPEWVRQVATGLNAILRRVKVLEDAGGGGGVTSVGLALPTEFSISGSPITSSGTLTGAWASQAANKVLASPNGAPGVPSFRALVAADIPTLSTSNVTEGSNLYYTDARARAALSASAPLSYNSSTGAFSLPGAALSKTDDTNVTLALGGSPTTALLAGVSITMGWTGQLAPGRGGTGLASYTVGDIVYASGTATLAKLGIGSANKVLASSGSAPQWTDTLVSLAAVYIGSSAALQGEKFNVIGGNGLLVRTQYVLSSTATDIALGAGLLLLLRDNVAGSTALVLYENAQTPIIIAQTGAKFVTAAPTGTQIQLADRVSHLGVSAVMAAGQSSTLNVAVFSVDDA